MVIGINFYSATRTVLDDESTKDVEKSFEYLSCAVGATIFEVKTGHTTPPYPTLQL